MKKRAVFEHDKREKTLHLVQVAAQLLEHEPFAALSMNRIAKVAKVAKGTLYLYFPTKEALALAVHRQDYIIWFEDLKRWCQGPENDFAAWLIDSLRRYPRFLQLIPLVAIVFEPQAGEEALIQYKRTLIQAIAEIAPLLAPKLGLDPNQVAPLLIQINAMIKGLWAHGFPPPTLAKILAHPEFESLNISFFEFLEQSVNQLLMGLKGSHQND